MRMQLRFACGIIWMYFSGAYADCVRMIFSYSECDVLHTLCLVEFTVSMLICCDIYLNCFACSFMMDWYYLGLKVIQWYVECWVYFSIMGFEIYCHNWLVIFMIWLLCVMVCFGIAYAILWSYICGLVDFT